MIPIGDAHGFAIAPARSRSSRALVPAALAVLLVSGAIGGLPSRLLGASQEAAPMEQPAEPQVRRASRGPVRVVPIRGLARPFGLASVGATGFSDTLGPSSWAQDPGQYAGKILRFNDDGSAPADNPFVNRRGYKPETYALGIRREVNR